MSGNSATLFCWGSLSYIGRDRGLWSLNQYLTSQTNNKLSSLWTVCDWVMMNHLTPKYFLSFSVYTFLCNWRSSLFWDVMQRRLLVWYRRFRTMHRPGLEGPSSSMIMWLYLLTSLKEYLWYLLRLYVMQVILTVFGTSFCVDGTAGTSYEKNITILNFHILGGFYFFFGTNVN
jgi:hypothetical protein